MNSLTRFLARWNHRAEKGDGLDARRYPLKYGIECMIYAFKVPSDLDPFEYIALRLLIF